MVLVNYVVVFVARIKLMLSLHAVIPRQLDFCFIDAH